VGETEVLRALERGEADVVLAGGSDSTSNAALTMPETLIRKVGPVVMGKKAGFGDYLGLAARLSIGKDLLPRHRHRPRAKGRHRGSGEGR
jgi:acetyl-CoA acyltransferase